MSKNLLPIFRRRVIRDDRRNLLVNFRFDNKSSGLPQDLSAYTLAGGVALTKGGTVLVDATFDNDLAGGIIHAYLAEADSKTIVAAAIAADTCEVYWDIKATPTGGEDEQWFEGTGQTSQVVKP